MFLGFSTDYKEDCFNSIFVKRVQNAWCLNRIRTIIKSENDFRAAVSENGRVEILKTQEYDPKDKKNTKI